MNNRMTYAVMLTVVFAALAMRLYPVTAGLPATYWHDENNYVEDALRMGSGNLKPSTYAHGGFYQLVLCIIYGAYFAVLKISGNVTSSSAFLINYLRDPSVFFIIGRTVSALCGTALVYLSYAITARIFSARAALISAVFMGFSLLMFQMSIFAFADIFSVFLLASAFLCVVLSIQKREDRKLYYSACVLVGLATAGKCHCVFGVAFLYVAAFLKYREENGSKPLAALTSMLFIGSALAGMGFFVGTPSAIFNLGKLYQDTVIKLGSAYVTVNTNKYRWLYFFTNHLRNGLGIPLEITFICGTIYAFFRRSKWDLLIIAFPLTHCLVLMNSTGFAYHIVPSVIFVSILSGRFLDDMMKKVIPNYSILPAVMVALIIVSPSLVEAIKLIGVIRSPDTRTIAKSWVEKNIKSGSNILEEGAISGIAIHSPQLLCDEASIKRELKEIIASGGSGSLQNMKIGHFKELYGNAPLYDLTKIDWIKKAILLALYPEYVIVSSNNDMPIGNELSYNYKDPYFDSYFEKRKAAKDVLVRDYSLEKSFIPNDEFTTFFPHLMDQDYSVIRKIGFDGLRGYARGPKIDIYKRKP